MTNKLEDEIRRIAENYLRVHSETSEEIIAFCPFHTNVNSPSFSINKKTGLWNCLSSVCGRKGNFKQLAEWAEESYNKIDEGPIDMEALLRSLEAVEYMIQAGEDDFDAAMDRITLDYENPTTKDTLSYLVDRGFLLPVLKHFEIGFSYRQKRIVIPIRDENFKVIGFIGRAIEEDHKPKYLYSKGLKRAALLFNLSNAKQYPEVFITEGSLDAIKVHQAGFPNVVSTLGANVSDVQVDLLNKYFNTITLLSDNDEAGEGMKNDIINRCSRKNIFVVSYPEGIKDPGECNEKQLREIINNRENVLDYLFKRSFEK